MVLLIPFRCPPLAPLRRHPILVRCRPPLQQDARLMHQRGQLPDARGHYLASPPPLFAVRDNLRLAKVSTPKPRTRAGE